jgi:hypothetical protein
MRNIMLRSALVLTLVVASLAFNGYLYVTRDEVYRDLGTIEQQINQKQSLIKLANDKTDIKPSGVSHRLALPSNRLSASASFQEISKTLDLARLDFQISPETTMKDYFTESVVELKFQNQSDQPIYGMISHIIEEFPGLVHPLEIVMWRDPESAEPLIHGKFRFEWLKTSEEKSES